jgi:ornithine carbamoyltransferase
MIWKAPERTNGMAGTMSNGGQSGGGGAGAIGARDLLTGLELSPAEAHGLLDLAAEMKARPAAHAGALAGKVVTLLFEKPSLRTRISFEAGVARLGGHAIYMDHSSQRLGVREPVSDYGKNLERWVHAIVARVHGHHTVEELAASASIPVINGLSDMHHPCQALADYLTLRERFGALKGLKVAYVGDGNNVCHSLILVGALLGVDLMVVTPGGYEPFLGVMNEAAGVARSTGASVMVTDELEALHERRAVYTDTWVSMGSEAESERRCADLGPYQVNERVMKMAASDAVFMHCLPAHRGAEVSAGVIDGARSVVYDQAENRMHVQNAALVAMLGGGARR